jgi:hypothetical protein
MPLGGAQALLLSVARRRHAEAAKAGATLEVLGEGRGARATWATELLWIYMAMGRARVGGAKKMISAGDQHSLVYVGYKAGGIWSFGDGMYGQLGHGGNGNEAVPRLIEALSGVVVVRQTAAGGGHSMVLTCDGSVFTWGIGLYLRAAGPRQLWPAACAEASGGSHQRDRYCSWRLATSGGARGRGNVHVGV